MPTIHPAAIEYHRKRWERADAYRFAAPGTPEAKMPGYRHPWAEVARQEQRAADEARARAAAEQDELEREILALRHELAKIRLDYELRRFQQKYSPDQPRVPAGNPDGGQWTSGGGSGEAQQDQSDAANKNPDDGPRASTNTDVQKILALAKQLRLAAGPQDYQKCLDLCYPLLERPLPRWSDRNTFDFHKCMNLCLGRNL